MRNTLPILTRTPAPGNRARSPSPITIVTPPHVPGPIPTIRLTAATPSAASVDTSIASPLAPKPTATRKRVVPKKSKLALLGGSKTKDKTSDFSDVTRRLGMEQNSNRSFDIYVDPTVDPDVGEIVVVKKKKSRAGLGDVAWGPTPLGDVTNDTNLPSVENGKPLNISGAKSKQGEKDKWWTIGRGRKDSKEKDKEKDKNKVKLTIKTSNEYRERAHSLDSGVVLNFPSLPTVFEPEPEPEIEYGSRPQTVRTGSTPVLFGSQLSPSESPVVLLPPEQASKAVTGSIANRAMRSVRSIARIGSWAQLKSMGPDYKEKEGVKEKDKKKKENKERKPKTLRVSTTSSFEAGGLSPVVGPKTQTQEPAGTVRTIASILTYASQSSGATSNRLSVESAMRRISSSSGSSIEPISPVESRRSSNASVRWMDQIETVKEKMKKATGKKPKESRRTAEARKRPALSALFPNTLSRQNSPVPEEEHQVTVQVQQTNLVQSTPSKPARPRPVSEQLLGQSRPRGMVGEADGVLTILDAATTDLANLINRLDLEATPDATPHARTPHSTHSRASRVPDDSPIKKVTKLQSSTSSFNSLRPYAQSRGVPTHSSMNQNKYLIGQPIAPWPVLNEAVNKASSSPAAETKFLQRKADSSPAWLKHKRTMSPPVIDESLPVFQPLQPAISKHKRQPIPNSPESLSEQSYTINATRSTPTGSPAAVVSSSMTFGVRPSRFGDFELVSDESFQNTSFQVAENAHFRSHHRKLSSVVSIGRSKPIEEDARRSLGMTGTMGSTGADIQLDPEDPDSDIPEELQLMMVESLVNTPISEFEDTMSIVPTPVSSQSPPFYSPPKEPLPDPVLEITLPVFRAHLIDENANEADIDENPSSESSEDDTKKSFDFTGELRKLNESGAAERRSFVEQLENAFKTPAKLDITRLGQDLFRPNHLDVNLPPVPDYTNHPLPVRVPSTRSDLERTTLDKEENELKEEQSERVAIHLRPEVQLLDYSLPEGIPQSPASVTSKSSDGQLNRDFKFGSSPSVSQKNKSSRATLTLSDIIPSPEHARKLSLSSSMEEDSSVMKSIMAQATELPELEMPRARVDSDSASKRRARQDALSRLISHRKQSSELSFAGFASFNQVRLGFEIGSNRPAFQPSTQKPRTNSKHTKQVSMFSIASISSYGDVIKAGINDPFEYGLPVRPLSDDMSMSMSIDDTFSFLRHGNQRKRVDSDASSFYFNAPKAADQAGRKRHGRNDSAMSIISNGPPISLYNRSYGAHRRSDSSTSASSIAHAYGAYGANGGRAAWARHHRNDRSVDSIMSEFSALRLGRPGLGDKMLESAHDYGMPLTAISASPTQSEAEHLGNRTSFDSLLDDEHRSEMEDSIFDNTENRSSMSSDSVFGYDEDFAMVHNFELQPSYQFRPLSMLSYASVHSPHEDDTMITMLGGGHVRRRSIGSVFEASPCVRVEKRMHDAQVKYRRDVPMEQDEKSYIEDSPDRARLIEKASLVSHKFGEGRMVLAQKGLLERQSLEDSCLSGEGEDSSTSSVSNAKTFRRPHPANRSRTYRPVSASSGAETPPLSIADDSSQSGGSQSSIDLSQLNVLLTSASYPASRHRRARARGQGHRRRISQAQVSHVSAYETIQEEVPGLSNTSSPAKATLPNHEKSVLNDITTSVSTMEPEIHIVQWDEEENGMILRKYYAWEDEAQITLQESKRMWEDTPFSLFALQSFSPPKHPTGMKALLEHSRKTYGPLPHEFRPSRRRSRTLSRPSPYPRSRKGSQTSVHSPNSTHSASSVGLSHINMTNIIDVKIPNISIDSFEAAAVPLQEKPINDNIKSPAPALHPLKPLTPFLVNFRDSSLDENDKKELSSFGLPLPPARPRVPSNARRSALGWSKRSTGKSSQENKENIGHGALMSPNESLRIVRPRPRGRPTPRQQILV